MLYLNNENAISYIIEFKFNFNKCCIWILRYHNIQDFSQNLTLTSVVFEFNNLWYVVDISLNLTLTSVVFESLKDVPVNVPSSVFNFNKCCIWILILQCV